MSAKLTTRQVGDVTIVDVSGRLSLGESAAQLRETLHDQIQQGRKKLLLNLSDVSYIDSSCVGEVVAAFTSIANRGGTLKLLGLAKRVKDILQVTKLYTVFEVYEDEAEALKSFA